MMPQPIEEKVDDFIQKHSKWSDILNLLRAQMIKSGLEETIKWGMPVYCLKNKNVIGLAAFNDYTGLWFYNGSFLSDPLQVLINAQEGKTKGMRHWKISSMEGYQSENIQAYIEEAISNQKAGKKIKAQPKQITIPDELSDALSKDKLLMLKFKGLTIGRQKEYFEYISEAKLAKTKTKRIDKIIPMIFAGKGLNDKYRKS